MYGLGLGVLGPFCGTLVPWLPPVNTLWLEKVGNVGRDDDVPCPSWGNDDGNAVFKGDVTILVGEACALLLRFPDEGLGFALVFRDGLPTLRLGSSLPLGAARFFVVPPAAGCFGVCLDVLVTAGMVSLVCFVISGTRILVGGGEISCN